MKFTFKMLTDDLDAGQICPTRTTPLNAIEPSDLRESLAEMYKSKKPEVAALATHLNSILTEETPYHLLSKSSLNKAMKNDPNQSGRKGIDLPAFRRFLAKACERFLHAHFQSSKPLPGKLIPKWKRSAGGYEIKHPSFKALLMERMGEKKYINQRDVFFKNYRKIGTQDYLVSESVRADDRVSKDEPEPVSVLVNDVRFVISGEAPSVESVNKIFEIQTIGGKSDTSFFNKPPISLDCSFPPDFADLVAVTRKKGETEKKVLQIVLEYWEQCVDDHRIHQDEHEQEYDPACTVCYTSDCALPADIRKSCERDLAPEATEDVGLWRQYFANAPVSLDGPFPKRINNEIEELRLRHGGIAHRVLGGIRSWRKVALDSHASACNYGRPVSECTVCLCGFEHRHTN